MTILVTGGGGFLGSTIVRQLVEQGRSVRSFSRRKYDSLERLGVDQVVGDICDLESVERACRDITTVHHTAAVAGIWGKWRSYYETNTVGTQNVLKAARRQGCRSLVFASSPSVTFDGRDQQGIDESVPYSRRWLCAYPHTKALAEQSVLAAHDTKSLRTCALRPHLIWGPGDLHLVPRLIERAQAGRLRRVGTGNNLVDMVYVDNAASAHISAADALIDTGVPGGNTYFISQGAPVRCWDWIDQLLALKGLPGVKKKLSIASAYYIGAFYEATFSGMRIRREPAMTRFLALQFGRHHYYSIDAARRDFGYTPEITTAEGMKRLANWLNQAQPLAKPPLQS